MLRIATYNIHFGGVGRESKIAQVLKEIDPDMVLLVEASNDAVVDEVAATLKMSITRSKGKHAQLALLSKSKPSAWEIYCPHKSEHPLLAAEFKTQVGTTITVYGCHLQCHYFRWNEAQRLTDIEAYLRFLGERGRHVHLLLGDFNAIAPNDLFDKSALPLKEKLMVTFERGHIYRDAIRRLLDAGYVDCFRAVHPVEAGFTLPTHAPHVRLDYVFASSALSPTLRDCSVVVSPLTTATSDHYPVVADFEF